MPVVLTTVREVAEAAVVPAILIVVAVEEGLASDAYTVSHWFLMSSHICSMLCTRFAIMNQLAGFSTHPQKLSYMNIYLPYRELE
jgi:hypothetical protein